MTTMSSAELRSVLHALGLRQKQFAAMIGYSQAQINAMCCGRTKLPQAVDLLLKLMVAVPEALDLVTEWTEAPDKIEEYQGHSNGHHR